jgi:hypothetical protein
LRLAPGEVSPTLPDVEVQASPAIGGLVGGGHVAVHRERAPPVPPRRSRAAARPPRRNPDTDAAKPA